MDFFYRQGRATNARYFWKLNSYSAKVVFLNQGRLMLAF